MVFLQKTQIFLKSVPENKIKFIGASPKMIDGMGDKASAKETMKKAGCTYNSWFKRFNKRFCRV